MNGRCPSRRHGLDVLQLLRQRGQGRGWQDYPGLPQACARRVGAPGRSYRCCQPSLLQQHASRCSAVPGS